MADFAALPLFTDAIMADCGFLSDEEFGLYMRVLILMWRSPGCRIPNDPEWISRRMQRPYEKVAPILSEFCQTDGNFWTQKRLQKEYKYVTKRSNKQRKNVAKRWSKSSEAANDAQDTVSDKPLETLQPDLYHGNTCVGITPTPTPTPSIEKDKDKSLSKKKTIGSRLPDDWSLPDDGRTWAKGEGLSDTEIENQAARFKDFWLAKPGQSGVKTNWNATWRNWIRSFLERNPRKQTAGGTWTPF